MYITTTMLRNPKYIYGSQDVQVPAKLHFGEYVLEKMHSFGDKIAFIDGSTHISTTYSQIVQESMNFAVSLSHLGVRKGQTVALCSENRVEFWSVVIGVCCTGATLTTINPKYLEEELKHVLNISKPEYVVISTSCYKLLGEFLKSHKGIKGIILLGHQRIDNVILYNDLAKSNNGYGDIIVNNRLARNVRYEEFDVVDVDGQSDTLFLLYSSGTTGLPKGVMLTHLNVIAQCCLPIGIPSHILSLIITPWFHVMGLVGTLVGLIHGRTSVFLPYFEVDMFLKTIEKYKVTQTTLVPPILMAIAKAPGQYNLSSVRLVHSGAAPFSKESVELVKKKFPNMLGVFQGYGMTEVALVITRFYYRDFETIGARKPGSVGKVVDGLTVKVLDLETGKPLGPNQTGEICAKGMMVMKGYIGKDRSEDFDEEGFYKTGDVGYYDDEGCFYIVDRLKELIKYNGYQVAPAELEALLMKHEAIKDAGVIGIPDSAAGELPLAFVVRQPGANVTDREVQEYVAGRLSNPKRLRGGVRFVDAIPRNASGKILRKKLRQMLKQTSKL